MAVSETIGQEAAVLCAAVLVGMGLFLVYDILRIFRRLVPHGVLWVGVEDVLYWLFCTAAVFVMLYRENDGMVRGFALGGIVWGLILYYLLFSRLLIQVNVKVWRLVFGFSGKIFRFFFGPPWKLAKKMWTFLAKQLKKFARAVKMGLCKR